MYNNVQYQRVWIMCTNPYIYTPLLGGKPSRKSGSMKNLENIEETHEENMRNST